MKRTLWDAIIGVAIASLLGWGIWVTDRMYCAREANAISNSDIIIIKETIKEIKADLEKQKNSRDEEQKKIIELLSDIKKDTKGNNKN